jgi:hypothetical protein
VKELKDFFQDEGVYIEVTGSRAGAQFVVSPGQLADPVALAQALRESTSRNEADFSTVTDAAPTEKPNKLVFIPVEIHEEMNQTFKESKLDNPVTLDQLQIPADAKWLGIKAQVDTYKPGSKVFLTVTSSPIVFGEATVYRDGTANLTGDLPIDVLEAGAHTIRVVGIRVIDGLSANSNGEIQISDEAMDEIQRFDDGTKATIKYFGPNTDGGVNSAYREVPLEQIIPWWTLWFVSIGAFLMLFLKRYRKIATKTKRIQALIWLVVATAPAMYFGWTQIVYVVMGVSLLIAIAGGLMVWFVPQKKEEAEEEVSQLS